MQEPKKDLFGKKFHRDFLDVPFLGCRALGKKKKDPKWDPFSSDYEKRKNVVTLLLKWAHHSTRRLKLLECAHNLEQPFSSLLSAWGRVLGLRAQLHLELVHLPAYFPEQVFLMVCHFASFLVYSIISPQPPVNLKWFLILVLSNAEYSLHSLRLSALCTRNILAVG